MAEVDTNKDGILNFEEFSLIMIKTINELDAGRDSSSRKCLIQ